MDSKAKVMIFLGAGASAALDIPTSKKFPRFIAEKHKCNINSLLASCVDYLRSTGKGEYNAGQLDAEDLRDWLVSMERTTESLSRIKSGSVPPLSKFRGDPSGSYTYVKEIRLQFDQIIRETYKEVPQKEAYQHYNILFQRLWNCGLSILPIFTTNYDQVLESYAEHPRSSINFVDGFSRGRSGAGTLRLNTNLFETSVSASNTALFFKLHGSTTWFKHKVQKEVIFLPFGSTPSPEYDNLLIYPTKDKAKILEDYPFNEYYKYLKGYLESESLRLCIVIGYSFGDPAINEFFETAIARGMRLLIIDPSPNAASLLSSEIGLASNQYSRCPTAFSGQYWDTHIKAALDKELQLLSS